MTVLKGKSEFRPGLKPCGHRVLVWPIPTERTTASGIIIHDTSASREDMAQIEAVVISVGPSAWRDQKTGPWAEKGQKVLIAKYSGLIRKGLDERTYRVINDLDIVGICEEENHD
jgi:co-chaperonin GroES (HSP10)